MTNQKKFRVKKLKSRRVSVFWLAFHLSTVLENRLIVSLRAAINKLDLFLLFLFPIKFLFIKFIKINLAGN